MAIHKRKRKNGVRYTAVIRVVGQPSESPTFDSLKQAERMPAAVYASLQRSEGCLSRSSARCVS